MKTRAILTFSVGFVSALILPPYVSGLLGLVGFVLVCLI